MQAHMWGIKTFYYSLINKAGSKMAAEDTPPMGMQPIDYDDQDDCEACKL